MPSPSVARSRPGLLCLGLLAAAASSQVVGAELTTPASALQPPAAQKTFEVVHLGKSDSTLEIADETRPILVGRNTLPVKLPDREGCTLHLGHGVPGGSRAAIFRASLIDKQGQSRLVYSATSASKPVHWTDAQIVIEEGSESTLVLSSSGGSRGAWARPYLSCEVARPGEPRPNVVLIDLGAANPDDLGAYGAEPTSTPNLDRLAQEGVTFEYAYAHTPSAAASLSSTLSGQYPAHYRTPNRKPLAYLAKDTVLPEVFSAAGYATAAFRADRAALGSWGFARGFDIYQDAIATGEISGHDSGDAAPLLRAKTWLRTRPKTPFFLLVAPSAGSPSTSTSSTIALNQLSETDAKVGELLKELEMLKVAQNTLFIVLASQGSLLLPDADATASEELGETQLRVPLLLRWHDQIPAKRRISQRIGLLDLAPTVLELAHHSSTCTSCEGVSRAAWLEATASPDSKQPLFAEMQRVRASCSKQKAETDRSCWDDAVSIRDDSFTYIHSGDAQQWLFAFPQDQAGEHDLSKTMPAVAASYRQAVQAYKERTALRSMTAASQ